MPDTMARYGRETDPTLLRLRLFGRMEARTLTGESVLPIGGKTRALLAILALSDRKPVLRSRLAELLWSKRPEEMARASLRQEIHRLLDALSPLGVEVIDVRRHSLALKPALTSVDAERILTATVRTADGVTFSDEPLLGELQGIDPALDEWLSQQRARLHQCMIQLFEGSLRELTDPAQAEEVAARLMRLDSLSESAWSTRIQLALAKGDKSYAAVLGREMLLAYQGANERALSSEARALLASVSGAESGDDAALHAGHAPPVMAGEQARAISVRPDPMLALPVQFTSGQGALDVSRRISLVLLPPEASDPESTRFGEILRDQFEVLFVQMGVFDILPTPRDGQKDSAFWRNSGIDYILAGTMRQLGNGAGHRLILRVLDGRRGGIIVWGTYFDVPATGPLSASFLTPAQAIQWNIFLAEARRVSERPDAELSPMGMGMRAFSLMLQQDRNLFPRISSLLDRAIEGWPDDGVLALLKGFHCYIRFHNDWSDEAATIFAEGLSATRHAMALLPDLHAVTILFGAYLMHDPTMYGTAMSVVRSALDDIMRRKPGYQTARDFLMGRIVQDILTDDVDDAIVQVQHILRNDSRSYLIELVRPAFILVLVMGEQWDETIAFGRRMAAMHPSCPLALVYYLVALAERGAAQTEIEQVRAHLLRIVPDFTISRIVKRFPYIDIRRQEAIGAALARVGLADA